MATAKVELRTSRQRSEPTRAARAAKAIRAALKVKFPGVKFGVTSSTFSQGNAVDVQWQDGPRSSEVEALLENFEDEQLDVARDSWVAKPKDQRFPDRVKYTHVRRTFSPKFLSTFAERAADAHGIWVLWHKQALDFACKDLAEGTALFGRLPTWELDPWRQEAIHAVVSRVNCSSRPAAIELFSRIAGLNFASSAGNTWLKEATALLTEIGIQPCGLSEI
jgi:hypothetical protein